MLLAKCWESQGNPLWHAETGDNDVHLLREVGFGVAMANAQPQVKEAADYITASNDEDGVARAIEKFALHR